MVDVSEPDTIDLAPTWKQDVLNHAHFTSAYNTKQDKNDIMAASIPVLLLGNKADKLEVLLNYPYNPLSVSTLLLTSKIKALDRVN